jgi:TolA-binding protein
MDSNPEADHGPVAAIMPLSSYKEEKPNIMAFVNLVIGVILGIAVTAILIIPTIKKNQTADDGKDIDDSYSITQLEEKDNQIKSLQDELKQLGQTNEQLQAELDNVAVPEDKSVYYAPLFDAANLYLEELTKSERNRNYTAITDLLYSIDETKLDKEASVTLLSKLKEETYPKVARDYYQSGYSYYSDGKYTEALVDLKKAMDFDPSDVDAVYFLARAYHRLEDKENAALYYNIVVTDFPDSSRVKEATKYLAQVQEQ